MKTLKRGLTTFGIGGAALLGLVYGLARVQAEGAPKSQPLWYSGSVSDASGKPLETKNYDVTLGLYEGQEQQVGEMAACSVAAKATRVVDGRFRIDVSECGAALQKNPDLFVELVIDAGQPFARAKIGAVPFALEAQHALASSSADGARDGSPLSAEIASLKARIAAIEGDRGGRLAGVWFANSSMSDQIGNSDWTDTKEGAVTFQLDRAVRFHVAYGMTSQPNAATVAGYVGARVVVDGNVAPGSGSHFQPQAAGSDPNGVLFGQYAGELAAGSHTVKLQWRPFGDNAVTWQSSAGDAKGIEGRTLVVEAFYK